MVPVYENEFESYADLPELYRENVKPEEIVYAGYDCPPYEGIAIVVFRRDGKLFENHDSHCSCYGLEAWSPEETNVEAIKMRPNSNWPGLVEAVETSEPSPVNT